MRTRHVQNLVNRLLACSEILRLAATSPSLSESSSIVVMETCLSFSSGEHKTTSKSDSKSDSKTVPQTSIYLNKNGQSHIGNPLYRPIEAVQ